MQQITFKLDDLFQKIDTNTLKCKVGDCPKVPDGVYVLPALTAGIANQGLSCYVPRENATILRNCISVSANGANSGAMFYQPYEFTVLQDAYAITLKYAQLNEYIALYLVGIMQKVIRGNYDWSNKAGWERIKDLTIQVPTTDGTTPDYQYMEQYMRQHEQALLGDIKTYIDDAFRSAS